MSDLTPEEAGAISANVWDAYRLGRAMERGHEDMWELLTEKPNMVEIRSVIELVAAMIAARVEQARADEREQCGGVLDERVKRMMQGYSAAWSRLAKAVRNDEDTAVHWYRVNDWLYQRDVYIRAARHIRNLDAGVNASDLPAKETST